MSDCNVILIKPKLIQMKIDSQNMNIYKSVTMNDRKQS